MTQLLNILKQFGVEKFNTFTKYPSILTLHKMGDRGMLQNELTTPITSADVMTATEKIDGTNVRIICLGDGYTNGDSYVIGSRENLLHYKGEQFFDPSQDIVKSFYRLELDKIFKKTPSFLQDEDFIHIVYGELYGGKVSANSKWYGTTTVGFRVFDIVRINVEVAKVILAMDIDKISLWREHENADGLHYGQPFLSKDDIKNHYHFFDLVPDVPFELGDMSHATILENLNKFVPTSRVALTDAATKKTEGVVIRNADRTKIVKLRFEDYERMLRKRNNG